MNKEIYEKLLRRFADELHEVGVTDMMTSLIKSQYIRTPNVSSCSSESKVSQFSYQHAGYKIEAVQTVKIVIKKCNP
jgi:hypothetical protein